MKILFNNIGKTTNYLENVELLHSNYDFFRQKHFSNLCIDILQPIYREAKLHLTHSATGALEMIALLMDLKPGDEVIIPSFTFVSTANAFLSRGATPVFVDIDPTNLNLDLSKVEQAITEKTKAVAAVHYAGHPCDLNQLKTICKNHNLLLIEDAAMSFGNTFEGQPLGTFGDFGVISFDITKHISAVQGGLLIVNNEKYKKRAGHIYHIGTNREDFMEGTAPYYEWVDVGSKFQMNELNAVALYDQLYRFETILAHRQKLSSIYYEKLQILEKHGKCQLIRKDTLEQNFHEFYVILDSLKQRKNLTSYMATKGIETMFHYIPLHNSKKGMEFQSQETFPNAISISERLLRLPLHTEMGLSELEYICDQLKAYFNE